jgi:hypothetical protein
MPLHDRLIRQRAPLRHFHTLRSPMMPRGPPLHAAATPDTPLPLIAITLISHFRLRHYATSHADE